MLPAVPAAAQAPAAQQEQQQQPSVFLLPAAGGTRVRSVGASGDEEHAADNPWVHMQLTDPFQQQQPPKAGGGQAARGDAAAADGDEAAAAAEAAPRPEEVMKAFASAKGELEWLLALLNTLQEGRYLTVGRCERTQGLQRLADLALGAHSRFKRRSAAAAAAASALSEGAAALAALGRREDAFYIQVAQLQRFWKVREAPPDSPYAYSVDLSLTPPGQPAPGADAGSQPGSGGGGDGGGNNEAAAVSRGAAGVVNILKDAAGMLRVQVPQRAAAGPPSVRLKGVEVPPSVYTGPAAIHGLLLQQLRLNAWHAVLAALEAEIAHLLGLPARLQPSKAAGAAKPQQAAKPAGGGSGSSAAALGAQQSSLSDTSGGSMAMARTVSTAASALPAQQQQQQQQPQQQQGAKQPPQRAFAAGGHLAFYAALSSLVLQSVIGAAATAGEAAVLEQQQGAAGQQAAEPSEPAEQRSATPDAGALSEGLLADVDVGCPWERAAAAAAAAIAPPPQALSTPDQAPAAAANGATPEQPHSSGLLAAAGSVCVDPQLLSLRPLALEHLLITQLGHLVVSSMRHGGFGDGLLMAAAAYAATARQMHERARHRAELLQLQQASQQHSGRDGQGGAAGAAAGGPGAAGASSSGAAAAAGMRPGSYMFGSSVSFMTCLSRWLAHSSCRDLLRARLDSLLAQPRHAGAAARTLPTNHSCVSAVQLRAAALQAAPPPAADGVQDRQQQRWRTGSAAARMASPLLLLTDVNIALEGSSTQAAAAAAGVGGSGLLELEAGRNLQVQQLATSLPGLPALLEPLLAGLAQAAAGR